MWVQVWTAQVPGSVQVEQSELAKIQGLESLKAMVPMLVEVREKEWELVPSVLVKDSPLVSAQMSETAKESALKKGWGWVLGLAEQSPQKSQQEQHKPE